MTLARRRFMGLAAAATASAPRAALGQSYPDRPVRIIVPYAPGGPTDTIARLIAQKFSERVGRQFFIENIGGAGGNIGMGRAAKAAPDGYTLLMVNPSYVVNPILQKEVPYRVDADFLPVSLAVLTTLVICVHPSVPAQNLKELIALIKSSPRKYSYASPGTGTPEVGARMDHGRTKGHRDETRPLLQGSRLTAWEGRTEPLGMRKFYQKCAVWHK